MTPSQEFTDRYKQTEREADDLGRVIVVGRLRVSQQLKISEMTPGLDGETETTGPNGERISIPRRALPLLAAAVREIDGTHIPFPRTRGELDAMMDRLDEPGFAAILRASARLNGPVESSDSVEQAKK